MPSSKKPLSKSDFAKLRASLQKSRASGRGAYRVRGRGAYSYDAPGPIGRAGRTLGTIFGSNLGNVAAGPMGAYWGGTLGDRIGGLAHYPARLFGSGAYRKGRTVRGRGSYSVSGGRMSQSIPQFGRGDEENIIEFREYLGDIISSSVAGAFKIQSFSLNPGMRTTFPWLAQIACNYQMYQMMGCMFEFKTFSADALNSTNTALGSVIGAVDYDSTSAAYTTRQQMENSAFSMSCKPSECMMVPIECSGRQSFSGNKLYVRTAALPANVDKKTYDVGTLYLATLGMQGTSVNVGSLYVTYRIKLFKPILERPLSCALMTAYVGTSVSAAVPLGATGGTTFDNMGITIGGSGTTVTIPGAVLSPLSIYQVTYLVSGSNTANVTQPSFTGFVNLSPAVATFGSAPYALWPTSAATQSQCGGTMFVQYTSQSGADAVFALGTASTYPAASTCNLYITEVNGKIPFTY